MAGRKWAQNEINQLRELAEQGLTAQQIFESGKFPRRSYRSIEHQLKRLAYGTHKKFRGTHVKAVEVAELEEIVKRYVDAFRQICEEREFTRDEIERFKTIFMAAWKYRELFAEYERVREVDERLAALERVVAELQKTKTQQA